MSTSADFSLTYDQSGRTATLTGDWTAVDLGDAGARLLEEMRHERGFALDLTAIGRCDTAGAFAIVKASEARSDPGAVKTSKRVGRLLELVSHAVKAEPVPEVPIKPVADLFTRVGEGLHNVSREFFGTMAFLGHLIVVVGRVASDPRRIRWAPIFSLAERAGIDAIPIVAVTTFFIGAVVGFLGANELSQLGASVFAVELVGVSVMREFNIVITAVLLAGRSASSFAAEIGSMKMNQEIDAMRIMGVDPFEALVLPRFVAMLITIPLLTFVATICGLAGGLLVCWLVLDISPHFFLQRILENVSISNFFIAMSKAPVMAAVIAGIGCRQGMEVGGDVESLGRRVTAAVVHAIFSIILIDALFAMLYMELKL